jgi:hypothetical protein
MSKYPATTRFTGQSSCALAAYGPTWQGGQYGDADGHLDHARSVFLPHLIGVPFSNKGTVWNCQSLEYQTVRAKSWY